MFFRPIHLNGGLKTGADIGFRDPGFTGFGNHQDPVCLRYAHIAEDVEPLFVRIQITPHRRTGGPLRRTGVPAFRYRCPQSFQQVLIQSSNFLVRVTPFQTVKGIGVIRVIPLSQNIQVIWFLRRIHHFHSQLRLGPHVRKDRDGQDRYCQRKKEQGAKPTFHRNSFPQSSKFNNIMYNIRRIIQMVIGFWAYSKPRACFQLSTRRQAVSITALSSVLFSTASSTLGICVR